MGRYQHSSTGAGAGLSPDRRPPWARSRPVGIMVALLRTQAAQNFTASSRVAASAHGRGSQRGRRIAQVPSPDWNQGDTFVVTLLVLLVGFGSPGEVSETEAVSVKFPFCVGFTTMVTVASAPLTMVPRVQTTVSCLGFGAQVP